MQRTPMPSPDPAKILQWRARSKPLSRGGLRLVGFEPTVIEGGRLGMPQRAPLKPVSAKRAKQNRERAAMADRLWPDRREGTVMCSVPGCTERADDLHEPLTRARGGSITDEENVKPTCRRHNDELTLEPQWGYDLGFLKHSWAGGDDAA